MIRATDETILAALAAMREQRTQRQLGAAAYRMSEAEYRRDIEREELLAARDWTELDARAREAVEKAKRASAKHMTTMRGG